MGESFLSEISMAARSRSAEALAAVLGAAEPGELATLPEALFEAEGEGLGELDGGPAPRPAARSRGKMGLARLALAHAGGDAPAMLAAMAEAGVDPAGCMAREGEANLRASIKRSGGLAPLSMAYELRPDAFSWLAELPSCGAAHWDWALGKALAEGFAFGHAFSVHLTQMSFSASVSPGGGFSIEDSESHSEARVGLAHWLTLAGDDDGLRAWSRAGGDIHGMEPPVRTPPLMVAALTDRRQSALSLLDLGARLSGPDARRLVSLGAEEEWVGELQALGEALDISKSAPGAAPSRRAAAL